MLTHMAEGVKREVGGGGYVGRRIGGGEGRERVKENVTCDCWIESASERSFPVSKQKPFLFFSVLLF